MGIFERIRSAVTAPIRAVQSAVSSVRETIGGLIGGRRADANDARLSVQERQAERQDVQAERQDAQAERQDVQAERQDVQAERQDVQAERQERQEERQAEPPEIRTTEDYEYDDRTEEAVTYGNEELNPYEGLYDDIYDVTDRLQWEESTQGFSAYDDGHMSHLTINYSIVTPDGELHQGSFQRYTYNREDTIHQMFVQYCINAGYIETSDGIDECYFEVSAEEYDYV